MSLYEIDIAACRGRQQRLIAEMQRLDLDLVIVTQAEHVQWLAGPRIAWTFQPAVALSVDGHLTLVAPTVPEVAAADEVLTYQAKWHSTLRNDQREVSSAALLQALAARPKPQRLGVEFATFTQHLAGPLDCELVDVEPTLYYLRRRKDADELAKIKKAIAGTGKMYQKAREIIRPGVTEIEVFNQLQAAAVEEFGEMLTGTGNDYRCAARGGPPRDNRPAAAGELYILDLGPAFRGYFADNCRTIAVTEADETQQQAWDFIMQAFEHVEGNIKPGKNAKELFHEVEAILAKAPCGEFSHHLGHGVGLFPHEAPHLNPHWDDCFEVGDLFAVEPGLYAPELKAGMRVENDYVVTETGIECLSHFPMEL